MTLDNFFAGSENVWKKELARREQEAENAKKTELDKKREQIKSKDVITTPRPSQLPATGSADFGIEVLPDCYRINGVKCIDGAIDLKNELLADGASKTQDGWVKFKKSAGKDDFVPAPAPTYHAICAALYDNRDNQTYKNAIEKARQFLAEQFRQYWLATLSRAQYHPQAPSSILKRAKNTITGQTSITLDEVIHDVGSSKPVTLSVALTGSQDYISKIPDAATYCDAVIGDKDVAHVNDMYKWITGKDTFAYRKENHPERTMDARAVVLGVVDYDSFDLDAYGDLINVRPALGVRSSQKISTGNGGQ